MPPFGASWRLSLVTYAMVAVLAAHHGVRDRQRAWPLMMGVVADMTGGFPGGLFMAGWSERRLCLSGPGAARRTQQLPRTCYSTDAAT